MNRASVVGVVLTAAVGLLTAPLLPAQGGGKSAYVELTYPQSDDRGRCVEPGEEEPRGAVAGVVSSRTRVRSVLVNEVPARLLGSQISALGAPRGWQDQRFDVTLPFTTSDRVSVVVTDAAGRTTRAQFVQDTDAVLSRLQALASDAPRNALVRCRVGSAFLALGQDDRGASEFRAAVEIDPDNASAHSGLGYALLQQEKMDEAIQEYRTAARLAPEYAGAHSMLGVTLARKGEIDQALAEMRRAIELDPGDPFSHLVVGLLLAAKGKPDEAITEHRKAIELDPRYAAARVELAKLLLEQDKFDEAAEQSRKALESDPQSAEAHVVLARAIHLQGDTEAAVTECQKALDADPNHAEAHAIMGGLLLVQQKPDECIGECRKALESDPTSARAYATLALALYQKGDYVKAEQMLVRGELLGFGLGEEAQTEIRGKARMMRSWMMDGRLTMAAMFLPLLGILAAMGVGSVRAGGREHYPRTLAWRQLVPIAFILTISLAAVFVMQALFRTAHIGPNAYGYVIDIMGVAAIVAGISLLALLGTISGRASKAARGPGGVPHYCAECRQTLNFWRMYYDGRKTTCANCLTPSGPQAPPPPAPGDQTLPPPQPPIPPRPPRGL